jgi:hypothetical protein
VDAHAATLTLTNAGTNISGGVYIGPYTATIDGKSFQVICDDFASETYLYESWNASTSMLTDYSGKFASKTPTVAGMTLTSQQGYDMAGWLAQQLFDNASNFSTAADIQFALWSVFSNQVPTLSSGSQAWLNLAKTHINDTSGLGNLELFTPVGNGCLSGPCPSWPPQEFIVRAVPEPATVLLLASGMCAIAARRSRRATR